MLANKGKVLFASCNKHVLDSQAPATAGPGGRWLGALSGKVTCDQTSVAHTTQSNRNAKSETEAAKDKAPPMRLGRLWATV